MTRISLFPRSKGTRRPHRWAGVTLSLKSMFGMVPCMKYGWPKNLLHWHRIHESILDICATVPVHFVIADGIVANGRQRTASGAAARVGKIVLSDDPIAADSTCARLMGLEPRRVPHLDLGSEFLGNLNRNQIQFLAGTDRVSGPAFKGSQQAHARFFIPTHSSRPCRPEAAATTRVEFDLR
jgi:uncharacterized protein (DUF362 family)